MRQLTSHNRGFLQATSFAWLLLSGVVAAQTTQSAESFMTVAQTTIEGATNNHNVLGIDYVFKGKDGGLPTAALIEDRAGNLYGTTSSGGSGFGVVFKLNAAHHESVLHAFTGPDGRLPRGSLVLDRFGSLYGTTSYGGAADFGTVFKIDPNGTETVLYSFTGSPDGRNPSAGLVIDIAGNLYGTTEFGGTSDLGTIFQIDTSGRQRVLHSFTGDSTDGSDPKASLIVDNAGKLYGTTFSGGTGGKGTVFLFDTKQNTEVILYNFSGGADGGHPLGGLTRANNGTLYGTVGFYGVDRRHGCCRPGAGVVFSLTGTTQKVLYTFTGGADGGVPSGNLVLSKGVLYGTTQLGGPGQRGTAFSLRLAGGLETVLHGFTGKADGATPQAGLSMNAAGVLYGTANTGGSAMKGTLFHLQN
jgi:uncharacterized repeat protein (TIGR03803 family)